MATWVMGAVSSTGYLGIVLLMFVENVFPPIPSEVIMPLAGYMVAQVKLTLAGIIAAGTVGSVLGALPLYFLGRNLGEKRLKEFADRHGRWLTVSRKDLEKTQQWFDRHGSATVFFCRLIPGVIWAALLAYLGYFLGSSFRKVGDYLDPASWVVFGAIGVIYAVRVIRHR